MSYLAANYVSVIFAILCLPVYSANKTHRVENATETEMRNRSISELRFPSIYHVTGTIKIPSASIVEPFEAWYAGKFNRSRIDYYGGTVKTFQRADVGKYGTLYEIIPKYDYRHNSHYQGCWKKNGKKKKKIEAQNVLPQNVYWPFKMNLAQFKFHGTVVLNGILCTKWVAIIEVYNKTDTYVFYASNETRPKPIRFEMQGYDILLTSYYDHYIVDYDNFTAWQYNSSIFNIPQVAKRDQWCRKLPKNIGEAGYRSINPMKEFLDREEYDDFERRFKCFKDNFGKEYEHENEHRKRMHIARHNMRYIHSMNRRELGYKLDVNHFTDLTEEEFKSHKGTLYENEMETNEYERKIPIFDENFEPIENNVEGNMKREGNDSTYGVNAVSKAEDRGNTTNGNKRRKGLNDEETEKKVINEIDQDDKDDGNKEKLDKFSQDMSHFDNAGNSRGILSRNLSERFHKKSEIAEKNFQKDLKELAFFGEKLDELSVQLNKENKENIKVPQAILTVKNDYTKKENGSHYGISSENDAIIRKGVSRTNNGNNKDNTLKYDKINKPMRAEVFIERANNSTQGIPNATRIKNLKEERVETNVNKNSTRQYSEGGYSDYLHSRKVLIEKTGLKRGKSRATIRKIKKGTRNKKEKDGFVVQAKTFEPISSEEINRLVDEDISGKVVGEFYSPRIRVRRFENGYIRLSDFPQKYYDEDAERRSLTKNHFDYNDFERSWRKPESSNVHPFFMFGVDRRQSGVNNNVETLEYDFIINDNSRFPKEFQLIRNEDTHKGKRRRLFKQNVNKTARKKTKIPKELDWRDYGALSPIQSQGICGSCWTFSTTAAVESAHFIKTGKLVKLSEQQLLDCTWYVPHSKEGNHGCMGGWTWKSFAFIKKFGLATSHSYGRYLGMENSCKTTNYSVGSRIDSFMKVAPNNAKALMKAIAMYGPATASINTEAKTLKFYKHGIYDDKLCNGATDHSVLVIGYGRHNGTLYWIVRNSWGTKWGTEGYVKIKNGRCGLLKKPWVIINRERKQLPWKNKIKASQLIDI